MPSTEGRQKTGIKRVTVANHGAVQSDDAAKIRELAEALAGLDQRVATFIERHKVTEPVLKKRCSI
jgi:hypothetical protein